MQPAAMYEFGPFRLDPVSRLLWRDSEIVPLTPKVIPWMIFWTVLCWIFMTCCGERPAAILKLHANCGLTALHFMNV